MAIVSQFKKTAQKYYKKMTYTIVYATFLYFVRWFLQIVAALRLTSLSVR